MVAKLDTVLSSETGEGAGDMGGQASADVESDITEGTVDIIHDPPPPETL